MENKNIFDDIQSRLQQVIDNSPVKDIEKNIRAMLTQVFSKLDLVTREETEIQTMTINQLKEQVRLLESRIAALEKKLDSDNPIH